MYAVASPSALSFSFLRQVSPSNDMISVSNLLPLVPGYFLVAWLAVVPRTRTLRLAIWPVITLLACRAAASVDMSLTDPDERYHNCLFIFSIVSIVIRTLDWTLPKEPLVRHCHLEEHAQSTILDALDLALTLRGCGWEWSRGTYIPHETRPTGRAGFTLHVFCSVVVHALVSGILHTAIGGLFPTGIGAVGGSIFDETLPFYMSYARASVISLFAAVAIYAFIQMCYDACTLVGVVLLRHPPELWPPAFDAPWCATSVSEFWARRWHQFFRRLFVVQGGLPLSYLFGRPGFIFGTFLSSALLHHIAMVILDGKRGAWRVFVGFATMAPAVLAERAFKRYTGRRVGGIAGWVWTMAWLLVSGNTIIDGFARAGVLGRLGFVEHFVPRKEVVSRVVAHSDAWLHGVV